MQIQITCCKYNNAQGIFKNYKEDKEENVLFTNKYTAPCLLCLHC